MRKNDEQKKINAFVYTAVPRPRDYFKKHGPQTGGAYTMSPNDEPAVMPHGNSTLDYLEYAAAEVAAAKKSDK